MLHITERSTLVDYLAWIYNCTADSSYKLYINSYIERGQNWWCLLTVRKAKRKVSHSGPGTTRTWFPLLNQLDLTSCVGVFCQFTAQSGTLPSFNDSKMRKNLMYFVLRMALWTQTYFRSRKLILNPKLLNLVQFIQNGWNLPGFRLWVKAIAILRWILLIVIHPQLYITLPVPSKQGSKDIFQVFGHSHRTSHLFFSLLCLSLHINTLYWGKKKVSWSRLQLTHTLYIMCHLFALWLSLFTLVSLQITICVILKPFCLFPLNGYGAVSACNWPCKNWI